MKKDILKIVLSALLAFIATVFLNQFEVPKLIVLILSYIIIGYDIIYKAVRNIIHGDVFSENFLMAIASIGAFIIGEHLEGVAVMVFYQTGELFQDYAVNKSRKSISSLMEICPDRATVIRDDKHETLDCEEIEIGETIIIKPGERIPLDAVILSGDTTIDTSAITGESVPRHATVDDEILSGCINESSVITARVTKEFSESTASKILELVETAQSKKSKSENFITKFARYYTPAVVISALLLAVIPPLVSQSFTFSEQIYIALSFLVASCPCALVISVPLSFFGGIGNAAKYGILVKGGNYLEALANAEIAVFDKTGTLTRGTFEVQKIIPESISKDELLEIAAYCEYFSNHPIAASIKRAYGKPIAENLIGTMEEIPGHGISATLGGKKFYAGNAKLIAQAGYNVPAGSAGMTTVYLCNETAYLGCIAIADEIKPDSKAAITSLKSAGISKTVMLTGDSSSNANIIADQLKIDEVYSDLLPQDKVKIAEKLLGDTSKNGKLIFVGDGINDTPVLSRADIGVAMGALGTDAAIDAADIVIMTDEPSKIAQAVKLSRYTLKIVRQNIVFSLFVKILVLLLCAFSIASMWAAVFADVGVSVLAILNAIRVLKKNNF